MRVPVSRRVAAVKPPPLLSSRPSGGQVLLALVVPIVGGAIAGVLLGVSELVYLVYSVLAIGAGYFGGLEHAGAEEGALRGFAGGLMFGTFILVAKELTGAEPKAHLPQPEILLVVLTTVLGVALGALGGRSRGRRASVAV